MPSGYFTGTPVTVVDCNEAAVTPAVAEATRAPRRDLRDAPAVLNIQLGDPSDLPMLGVATVVTVRLPYEKVLG